LLVVATTETRVVAAMDIIIMMEKVSVVAAYNRG